MEWMINIAVFSVISSFVLKLMPGKTYFPYVKLLTGIVIILLFLEPVFSFFQLDMETDWIKKGEAQMEELEEQYWKMLEEQVEKQEDSE